MHVLARIASPTRSSARTRIHRSIWSSPAGSFGAFDTDWEDPQAELFFRRLASFARVIRFDRRGTGGSDPLPLDALPPWETFVEELECVMEEVGSQRGCADDHL